MSPIDHRRSAAEMTPTHQRVRRSAAADDDDDDDIVVDRQPPPAPVARRVRRYDAQEDARLASAARCLFPTTAQQLLPPHAIVSAAQAPTVRRSLLPEFNAVA